jgi:hypothetical protein
MMRHLPWRAHNPFSWAQEVSDANLCPAEEAALVRLRDHQWSRGYLPAGPTAIKSILEVGDFQPVDLKRVRIAHLLLTFFPLMTEDPTRRRDERLHVERERALARAERQSRGGKLSAAKLWGHKEGPETADRHSEHGSPNASPSGLANGSPRGFAVTLAPDNPKGAVSREPSDVSRDPTASIPREGAFSGARP